MEGFISINRKIISWEWYTDNNVKSLFIHCLLKANFKNKKWRGQEVKRGSFITSYGNLSKELGLSVQQVRTALYKLKLTGEINTKTTNKNTVVTVIKYNDYQNSQHDSNTPDNNQITIDQQSNNNQITTTNKDNKGKNDNKGIIKEDKKNKKTPRFNFRKSLIDYGFEEPLVDDWMLIRKKKKAINSERAFKKIITEVEKTRMQINDVLEIAVDKQWKGIESDWIKNQNNGYKNNSTGSNSGTAATSFRGDEFD